MFCEKPGFLNVDSEWTQMQDRWTVDTVHLIFMHEHFDISLILTHGHMKEEHTRTRASCLLLLTRQSEGSQSEFDGLFQVSWLVSGPNGDTGSR